MVGKLRGDMSWWPAERSILGERGASFERRVNRMYLTIPAILRGILVTAILLCVLIGGVNVPSRNM